ncbi:MAG: hypothetical protein JF607_18045 [Burkholderiales bacterium]|nr:hypothetical protein [Burkholderiales bacterium]
MLDCTFFLYESEDDAKRGVKAGGTGFAIGLQSEAGLDVTYFYGVSNWHVIRNCPVVRVRTKNGRTDLFNFGPEDWHFDKNGDDLAVVLLNPNFEIHSLAPIPTALIQRPEVLFDPAQCNIGLGDDVFLLGRFVDLDEGPTILPVARFGNLAAMPTPIQQEGPAKASRATYCLDMHSRGGFSGSPVFVYKTPGSDITYNLQHGKPDDRTLLLLLGVHSGQFPEEWKVKGKAGDEYVKGLSGMTTAVPSWRILDLLASEVLYTQRAEADKRWAATIERESNGAVAELAAQRADSTPGVSDG